MKRFIIILFFPILATCQKEVHYNQQPYNAYEKTLRSLPTILPKKYQSSIFIIPKDWQKMDSMSFLRFKNIKRLQISSEVDSIPSWLGKLTSLEEFNYSFNEVKQFPKEILKLKDLKRLSLSFLESKKIPNSICQLNKLEKLSLSGKSIEYIPSCIGDLSKMRSLTLEGNISLLPTELSKLSLDTLVLTTSMTDWPNFIDKMNNLKYLEIKNSPLNKLPNSIIKNHKLKVLNITGTNVDELPENVGALPDLEVLDITKTHISKLPNSFYSLNKLRQFKMDYSKIAITLELREFLKEIKLRQRHYLDSLKNR